MRACGILFLFFQLSKHEMYDLIIFNSGDTYLRGGRNVQKVEDEYLYSWVAFYMQKWTRRSTCLVIPLIIKWKGTSLVLLGRKLYRKKSKKIYHAGWYSDARGDDKLMFFFHAPYSVIWRQIKRMNPKLTFYLPWGCFKSI